MTLRALVIAAALAVLALSPAAAAEVRCSFLGCGVVKSDPRPHAWCGWYARHELVAEDPGPKFNRARAWATWGKPARPGPGVIVVWAHHVGKIIAAAAGGLWIVKSGNDGHAVRERPRSIARAIAFRAE